MGLPASSLDSAKLLMCCRQDTCPSIGLSGGEKPSLLSKSLSNHSCPTFLKDSLGILFSQNKNNFFVLEGSPLRLGHCTF